MRDKKEGRCRCSRVSSSLYYAHILNELLNPTHISKRGSQWLKKEYHAGGGDTVGIKSTQVSN